jgi:RNA-binding protein Nova
MQQQQQLIPLSTANDCLIRLWNQVKVLVPNSTAGMIIGKGGSYIKQIKEESGAYVQISQKSRDHALAERCITIIGESDGARKACAMVLQKIVEDPQSGSCLNVSYADVTGPVANFNPTGSPYASTGGTSSGQSNVTHSNPSYSSNGSLNSLSPTLTNSFNSPQQGNASGAGSMMHQFGGVGLGSGLPAANSAQMIESIKTMLRVSGYSEDAVSEISSAMNTLANYGMLGLGLGLGGMFNSMNGAPIIGSMGSACHTSLSATNNSQMYADPGMGPAGNFGPVGSNSASMSMSQIGYPPQRQERSGMVTGGGAADNPFEPIRTNGRSPPLASSPGTGSSNNHNYNNNSFGLGIMSSPGRKSPSPADGEPQTKMEMEIGDNIVGAILGHGGKSLVEIQRMSGANIQISKKGIFVPGTRNRIVTMTGSASAVSAAQYLITQQIGDEETKRQRQNSQNQPGLSSVLR